MIDVTVTTHNVDGGLIATSQTNISVISVVPRKASWKPGRPKKNAPRSPPKLTCFHLFGQAFQIFERKVMAGVDDACYRLVHPATGCYRLSHSATACSSLIQPVSGCNSLLQPATACYSLLERVTGCHETLTKSLESASWPPPKSKKSSKSLDVGLPRAASKRPSGAMYTAAGDFPATNRSRRGSKLDLPRPALNPNVATTHEKFDMSARGVDSWPISLALRGESGRFSTP